MDKNEQLEKLEQKKREIERKISEIRAKQSAEERKRETRKKVLVGAMILQRVDEGIFPKQDLLNMLDAFLVRDIDRMLFGLEPKSK